MSASRRHSRPCTRALTAALVLLVRFLLPVSASAQMVSGTFTGDALQPQQPLLLTMNCLNGFFHFPPLNSLAEAMVKAEGKGAIAPSLRGGLSLNDAAHVYHKALLAEIVSGRHQRLGEAVLTAQAAYADSSAFPELLSIYHLFGDPALKIQ